MATGAGTNALQATIVGGLSNSITNNVVANANSYLTNSAILGGLDNAIQIDPASIAGATSIQATQNAIIGGSSLNIQPKSLGTGNPSANNNVVLGGLANTMYTYGGTTNNNGIVAGQNNAMTSTGSAFSNAILGGLGNQVYESSYCGIVAGQSNFINTSLNSGILAGSGHTITTSTGCCILGGRNNQIFNSTGCSVMGSNHILNAMTHCTVAGYYSNTTSSGGTALLIVGNGNAATRSNALRVDRSGGCFAGSTFVNGGADFAEYFEAAPGTSFRVGQSVFLDGNGFLVDQGIQPFGVVRPKNGPITVVGNAAEDHWQGMWLRDDDGCEIWTADGQRILNPEHDHDRPYVSRRFRPEWYIVGLVGRVLLLPGQPVAPSWLFIRRYNQKYDEWLVR